MALNKDKLWIDGWEKRPYQKFATAKLGRFDNLKPKILSHGVEGVFSQIDTLYNFACRDTKYPVHLWFADKYTTSLLYEKHKGSWRRVLRNGKPVQVREGYDAKIQTLPLDRIAWSAKSVRGAVNFGGRIVVALEGMMWAADAGYFTDGELERLGLAYASISRGIMEATGEDFIPQAYRNIGAPWPKSRGQFNKQRMKRAQYLDDEYLDGRNVIAHADLPRPNSHGDVADLNLGKVCEFARSELNQTLPEPEPEKPAVDLAIIRDTVSGVIQATTDLQTQLTKLQEVVK